MAKYFINFPKTIYSQKDSKSVETVTNLTTTFSFDENITENSVLYYQYDVSDGETPEIVAHKIYGSSESHWIILKMNGIVDVKTDWPLDQRSLSVAIDKKYANNGISTSQTGYQWAFNNNHSYYKIETRTIVASGDKIVDIIQVDANTFANITTSSVQYTLPDNNIVKIDTTRNAKTYYQYEVEENDKKRSIKVIKPELVTTITNEFLEVINV
jgi:predicted nucleic-acid-binding Zn-ribbon protein